jgi:hypothetical protein
VSGREDGFHIAQALFAHAQDGERHQQDGFLGYGACQHCQSDEIGHVQLAVAQQQRDEGAAHRGQDDREDRERLQKVAEQQHQHASDKGQDGGNCLAEA